MILYHAKIQYGSATQTRTFYHLENACKWLYSFSIGQYYINDTQYTKQTLKQTILNKTN